ncbi:ribosomal-protein-alanine acetyltransferase [Colletotrichum truncatum]|uniref:Ribosomal-protein-alanine acetyltransferase n=1 Tax=Colletotrichum truncatum TaxID=5467 RepID=A0ACC3YXR5_COLTU|nr:ribosomal-protein-alanine acetyltransferase [Colletotrichum truncatum]KAF6790939.1 ribosomal-protein-alanine acetyltransferase [Colletotrichum truncatum]
MLDFDWHIGTPRLYISHLNPSNDVHCDFLIEYMKNRELDSKLEDMSRSMSKREAIAKLQIEPRMARMEASGWGRYLVSLKPPSTDENDVDKPFSERRFEPVGCVTMQLARFPGGPTVPDIGFSFLDRYQGKGYATEAAQRLMKYFEEERGQKGFLGVTDLDNENAKKMFRRLGFKDRGVRDVNGLIEGKPLTSSIWSLGLEGDLEQYGFDPQ